jgi:multicomponent Na+:H+ antiporter subunit C
VTRVDAFLALGVALAMLGTARLLLTADLIRRVLALNVAGAGVLLVLVALAARADPQHPDPVLHALVLTGIVITVSVTGVALGLARRVEDDLGGGSGNDRPGRADGHTSGPEKQR